MSSRVGVNLRASAYLHQGDRKYMEDEFQVAYQRTQDKKDIEYAFFGIFDGHGGKEAAHFAKDNLMDFIVSQKNFWSDDDDDVLAAIKEGFLQTHLAMKRVVDQWPRTSSGWPSTSGTTASVAFIRKQKIYIGHAGDSGIVLGYENDCEEGWHGEALTVDHKPESLTEKTRITECGGKVINKSGVPRVVWNRPKSGHQGPVRRSTPMDEIPFLAVARSLGDLWSYNVTNDQFVVSPEPDVCVIPIDITRHRCLIFGTDGLWNMLMPDSAVRVAYSAEKNNEKHYLGIPSLSGKMRLWMNPSRSIVSSALERYARLYLRADNTSAITIFLDPPGRPKREVLLQQKNRKKGISPKTSPRKTSDDRVHEATVKVHIYNQNQSVRHEGYASNLLIKERMPDALPPWIQDSHRNTAPWPMYPEERLGWMRQDNGPILSPVPSAGGSCTECSSHSRCTQHTRANIVATHPSLRPSDIITTPKNDIQIPVVSSSTRSPKVVAGKASLGRQDERSRLVSRRTRSGAVKPLIGGEASENLRQGTTMTTPNNNCWSPQESKGGSSDRVLKSVNGRTPVSAETPKSLAPTKRKRLTSGGAEGGGDGETPRKTLRVHTRAQTWSDKSMVTRSQEKSRTRRGQ